VINSAEISAGAFWLRAEVDAVAPALCAPSFVWIAREMAARELWPIV